MMNGKHQLLRDREGDEYAPPTAKPDAQIGWMTEAKDWAGELISGQSATGRILVCESGHSCSS